MRSMKSFEHSSLCTNIHLYRVYLAWQKHRPKALLVLYESVHRESYCSEQVSPNSALDCSIYKFYKKRSGPKIETGKTEEYWTTS